MPGLTGSIKDWPRPYEQTYKHLKSGGWVEAQDHDVRVSSDDETVDQAKDWVNWMKRVNGAAGKFGKILNVGPRQKEWMIDAGFVDVHEEVFKVCFCVFLSLVLFLINIDLIQVTIGRWPKDRKLKEPSLYLQALNVDAMEPISYGALYSSTEF